MNNGKGALKEYTNHIRDYDYEVVCGTVGAGHSYPTKYEIPRENTGTLKNQGDVGCCVAEVISQIAEELWKRETGNQEEMSEGFGYASLRDNNSNGYGLIPSTAMKLWTSIGTLPKKYFDKLCEMPEIKKLVNKVPDLYEIATKYKLSSFVSLNYNKQKRDLAIKDALTKYQYGLVAISNDYFSEGHAIQLVGWNDDTDSYIFKNSWGEKYGDKGFSEIPKDEINSVYLPLLEPIKLPFTDIDEKDWCYKYIKNMYFAGFVNGTTETTFEPNKPMTRAEVTTLIYRVLENIDKRFDIFNKVIK